jgi:hypothetical protein
VDGLGLNLKGTRLTIALEDETGKMFGIFKFCEIGMKTATNNKVYLKPLLKLSISNR